MHCRGTILNEKSSAEREESAGTRRAQNGRFDEERQVKTPFHSLSAIF
jgi:hypothetical protein